MTRCIGTTISGSQCPQIPVTTAGKCLMCARATSQPDRQSAMGHVLEIVGCAAISAPPGHIYRGPRKA